MATLELHHFFKSAREITMEPTIFHSIPEREDIQLPLYLSLSLYLTFHVLLKYVYLSFRLFVDLSRPLSVT